MDTSRSARAADTMGIGDFSRSTGLSVSAVRFYGERGLLAPAHVDASSGYRRFDAEQVEIGRLIRDLRRLGLPLDVVAAALSMPPNERRSVVDRHVAGLEDAAASARLLAADLGAPPNCFSEGLTVSSSALAEALTQVLPASGTDPSVPQFMVALIEVADGSVRVVATDRYRLAVRDLALQSGGGEFRAVVASATMEMWRDRLAALPSTNSVLGVDGDDLVIDVGDALLRAPMLPIEFPPYEQILGSVDTPRSASAQVNRPELLAGFERCAPDGDVALSLASDRLMLRAADHRADIATTTSVGAATVVVNGSFAIDALRAAVGGEVLIDVGGSADPVIFRSADDGTYTAMIMPILPED